MATEAGNPPTTESEASEQSVGDLVRDASAHLSTLIRGEIELAQREITSSLKRAGLAAAFLGLAAAAVAFAAIFVCVAFAEGMVSLGLPRWGAYLIVWGALLGLAGLAGLLGWRFLKKTRKPDRTIETVKDTAAWVRHPTRANPDGQRPEDT